MLKLKIQLKTNDEKITHRSRDWRRSGCKPQAAEYDWLTDLPKAQAQAKKENKMVLMDFTGSDWCRWCIKFDKEVLTSDEFTDYAKTNLVLVEVDFPAQQTAKRRTEEGQQGAGRQNISLEGFSDRPGVRPATARNWRSRSATRPGGPKRFHRQTGRAEEELISSKLSEEARPSAIRAFLFAYRR